MSTYRWGGYEFSVHDYETTDWPDVGGIYIFAKRRSIGPWDPWLPLYVGRTESFAGRLPGHNMWAAVREAQADHVHVLAEQNDRKRTLIEALLIQELEPPLNDQGT